MTVPVDCWVDVPPDSDFTLANLPFGVAEHPAWTSPHVVVAIGDLAVDCHLARLAGLLGDLDLPAGTFDSDSLNPLLALGRSAVGAVRDAVYRLLTNPDGAPAVHVTCERRELTMIMPVDVGDYVDFYSSEHHARNVAAILRPGEEPLAPNWKQLPVGYQGRAGSVQVSGTPVIRPHGMIAHDGAVSYQPSRALDFELEIGVVVGAPSEREPVEANDAERHLAGLLLLNDWSARDIQAFEYRPLGPHLGKSFATSVSPWLVTFDALEPFRVEGPPQAPRPAEHLRTTEPAGFDLTLEVLLSTTAMRRAGCPAVPVSATNFSAMYWTPAQQFAHLTSGGASTRTGDLLGSGTVSGSAPDEVGSLIELTASGAHPMTLPNGERRSFLEDGDEVTFHGWAGSGARRVGFGEVTGRIDARMTD